MPSGERVENQSLSSSKKPIQTAPDFSECSVDKQTDGAMDIVNLPSDLNFDQTDTIDNSNCATSPSKSTYLSSIPGTIYYNGLDSVAQPHIENARKVSDLDASQLYAMNDPALQKNRPSPVLVRGNSEQSSVPRMQWTPPQPLSGNDHPVQSSTPRYTTKSYGASANRNIVPAIPVEELSMDGFTDKPLKSVGGCFWDTKGYKMLLVLTAIVIALAISAVIFSILYVTDSGERDQSSTLGKNKRACREACYDPFQPTYICECGCYSNKDDKYYTCGPQTDDSAIDPSSHNDDFADGKKNSNDQDSSDQDSGDQDSNDQEIERGDDGNPTWYNGGGPLSDDVLEDDNTAGDDTGLDGDDDANYVDDDDSIVKYDDVYDLPPVSTNCPKMCYRKNIHRDWNNDECHIECYGAAGRDKYNRNIVLYYDWLKPDL